jgi:hypothetical protein
MTTIIRRVPVAAGTAQAWEAIADPARVDELFTFLGPTTVRGDHRTCSLGDQGLLEELLVATDAHLKRVAYSITSSPFGFVHHHASMEIVDDPEGAVLVWTTDFLPDGLRETIEPVIDLGVSSILSVLGAREPA